MQIVTPKCLEMCQSGAICIFYFANLGNLDVKIKNCTNWFIIRFCVLGVG